MILRIETSINSIFCDCTGALASRHFRPRTAEAEDASIAARSISSNDQAPLRLGHRFTVRDGPLVGDASVLELDGPAGLRSRTVHRRSGRLWDSNPTAAPVRRALKNLGSASLVLRQWPDAVLLLRAYLQLEPNDYETLTNLAQALGEKGCPELWDEAKKGRGKVVYLERLPAIRLARAMDLVFNSEPRHGRHATQALSQRSDGCPVGSLGTDVASSDPGGGPAQD